MVRIETAKVLVEQVKRGETQKLMRERCVGATAEPSIWFWRNFKFISTLLSDSVDRPSSWKTGE